MLNQNLEFESMGTKMKSRGNGTVKIGSIGGKSAKPAKLKSKGIPFGVLLAGKVYDGTKTMTRRAISVQADERGYMPHGLDLETWQGEVAKCPYAVGQLLYVREPWQAAAKYDKPSGSSHIPDDGEIAYLSDNGGTKHEFGGRRRIARFMPARFARTFLRVMGVRCERLGEITEVDAINEGIDVCASNDFMVLWRDYSGKVGFSSPTNSFFSIWDSINGKDSHLQNPWVWVISFERVEMPNPWNESVPMVVLSSYGMASWDHPITKMGYVVNVTAAVGGWVWKIDRADLRTVRKSVLWDTEAEAIHDLNRFLRLSIFNPAML